MPHVIDKIAYSILNGYKDFVISIYPRQRIPSVVFCSHIEINGNVHTISNDSVSFDLAIDSAIDLLILVLDDAKFLLVNNDSPYAKEINPRNEPIEVLDVLKPKHVEQIKMILLRRGICYGKEVMEI